jgi:hypothetical protein
MLGVSVNESCLVNYLLQQMAFRSSYNKTSAKDRGYRVNRPRSIIFKFVYCVSHSKRSSTHGACGGPNIFYQGESSDIWEAI